MKSKQAHSKRPSKLETLLRLSIKFAKLESRINLLEAEVLELNRERLFKLPRRLDHEMRPEFQ